ncbi:transporter substrate-binding domain-containing protein [Synechococcus sp. A15-28]|uniref:transporter substrate-binding domain-containing protein n=1 Tax=Synechococcus sp. A15-28 TaxID=1050638 RepID=UPI00185F609B|nr:transporter substrate-binding domain-containing protein [Synechococcus sp. A15-28]QNI41842.1 putative ligand gated channel (GIC family) [Synechococcus sp. A15-28]
MKHSTVARRRGAAVAVGLLLGLQQAVPPLMARTLKVGVSGNAPFVIQKDGGSSGISLDIWRRIAEDNNLSYRLIKQATPRQGILALNKGEIDLLVGPISITAERLNGQRAAVLEGTSGEELAEEQNMRIAPSQTLGDAIETVLTNRADAVIFDRPAIRYHLKNNPELAVQLAPFTLAEQTYGFAFRTGDPLRTPLNISILKLQRSGAMEDVSKRLLD